jgi:hypothetical protein
VDAAFTASAALMLTSLALTIFMPDNPVWKGRISRLIWVLFALGLIGSIVFVQPWPRNYPVYGGG